MNDVIFFMKKVLYWIASIVAVIFVAEYNSINVVASNATNKARLNISKIDSSKYSIAGEMFPFMHKKHLQNYKSYEYFIVRKTPENEYLVRKSQTLFQVIVPILHKYGVPEDFKYLAVLESGLDKSQVSTMNAVGVWQLMKQTAESCGLTVTSENDERLDLEKSTIAVCKLLKAHKREFGTWTEALLAYNMGNTALATFQKRAQNYDDVYRLNIYKESMSCIYKLVAYKTLFKNLNKYGFKSTNAYNESFKSLILTRPIKDLQKYALKNHIDIDMLMYNNHWIKANHIEASRKKKYILKIPK